MENRGTESGTASSAKRALGYFWAPGVAPDQRQKALLEQEAAFFTFCNLHGFEPTATFTDTDDGAVGSRPSYTQMLEYLRHNDGTFTVVAHSLEAFGPVWEAMAIALLEFDDLGARVYLADGELVDPSRVVMGAGSNAEQTGEARERIKTAMRQLAIKGEGLGKPPYGYRIGQSRKLEIAPEEAKTARLIYSLYTQEDLGIRRIVRHLNENHIPTRRGRNWSMVTIRDILRNRAYLGTYTRFGMRVPGSHPAIITPDMFRWAQSRLEERRPSRKELQAEPFLLSGLVYCGSCGNRMVGVTRRQAWTRRKDGSRAEKTYRYYQCQSRTNQGVCQYHTRQAEELERTLLEHLEQQQPRLAALQGLRSSTPTAGGLQRERRKLETERQRVERRLNRSLHQVAAGQLSLTRFRPLGAELIRARRQLRDRLVSLDAGGGTAYASAPQGQQAALSVEGLSTRWSSMEFTAKRALLQRFVERVTVFDDHSEITLLGEPPGRESPSR